MVKEISPRQAADLMRDGAALVDIREENELGAGVIPGARNAPLSNLGRVDLAVQDQAVIFHCRSGRRTAENAEQLERKAGSGEVYIVAGGLEAWRAAGLPVEQPN